MVFSAGASEAAPATDPLNNSSIADAMFQLLTYPSGWTTPHNPYSEASKIGNYVCDMKSMRLDAPAPHPPGLDARKAPPPAGASAASRQCYAQHGRRSRRATPSAPG
jgi:hypothetical protein